MSDRELLELAAKAASLDVEFAEDGIACWFRGKTTSWAPLFDDGDALRLATELRIEIRPYWQFVDAESGIGCASEDCEDRPDSRNAACRRAIVLAAAEIGRAMP